MCYTAPTPLAAPPTSGTFSDGGGGHRRAMLEPVAPAGQVRLGAGGPFSRLTPLLFL